MSKLAPHIIIPTAPAMTWAAHAPLYKRLGAAAPVVRVYWPDPEQNSRIAGMAVDQTAADIAAVTKPGQWVEVFNEVAQRQGAGLEQHADFMEAIVPKLHDHGFKVAGFSFSVGNPGLSEFGDRDDAQYLYNRQFCGVDAIAMHCYFGKTADPAGAWNRAYAFRYRAFHDAVPHCPPILITECGIDAVPGGARGWKAAGISGSQYLDLLSAFDAELAKDAYVLGACVFTAGPSVDWQSFGTDELDTSRFWTGATTMTFDDAKAQLEQQFGWTPDYAEHALAYYEAMSDVTTPDAFVGAYQQQAWREGLAAWNPKPSGGTPVADEATQDAQIATEMDRETHLAVAAYAMAKMLNKLPTNLIDPALQNEYQAHINALDPSRFRF